MKKPGLLLLIFLLSTFGAISALQAAHIETDMPANTYITHNGLDWAWAYPLPANSGIDMTYQSQFGWRLPTVEEMALAPDATDFMFTGANVPLGGADPVSSATFTATNASLTGAAACAVPYFSNSYYHCDWQDGNGQPWGPWANPGDGGSGDQLVVRGESIMAPPIPPVPSMTFLGLVLMLLLTATFGLLRLRKN